jgi:nitrogen fixation NifU-like protein
MEEKISELYDAVIMQHNRNPIGYEKHPDAAYTLEAYNPICGDKFKLYLDIEQGRVVAAHFSGYGCAISKAATSVLVGQVKGQSLGQVKKIIQTYFETLDTEGGAEAFSEGATSEFLSFAAVRHFPERLACATLSWAVARDFFNSNNLFESTNG